MWYNNSMLDKYIKDENSPIVIGFAGKAGSGKTSVAETIVPKGSIETVKYGIKWDHIFFALPLYELSAIRRNIMGNREQSRKLYAIHEVLYDIFGSSSIGNIPDYDSFIEMVYDLYSLPIEPEGLKPRTFLQKAGDICRDFDDNCFTNWGIRKAKSIYKKHILESRSIDKDHITEENEPIAIIISDVRFENEAQAILDQPNGILVCFDASDEVLNDRIMKRDGQLMKPEQLSHKSEQYINKIKEIATIVLNTNEMNVEQQATETLKAIGIKEEINA